MKNIRFHIIALLLIFNLCDSNAQDQKTLDSLLRKLDESIVDSVQLKTNRLIGEYYMNNNNRKAIGYFEKAKGIAKQLNRKLDMASNLYSIGYCYMADGFYDKSLDQYLQSIRIYEELKDDRRLANAYLAIVSVYAENKNFEKSNIYWDKAKLIVEKRNDSTQLATLYSQKANIYFNKNDFDSALIFLKNEYELSKLMNDEFTIVSSLGNIGLMYNKMNRTKEALEYCMEALRRIKSLDNANDFLAQVYNNIGSIYINAGEYNQAKRSFDTSIYYSQLMGSKTLEMENYLNLSEMYGKMNNYKEEVLYLKKHHSIKDSVFTRDSKNQLTELEADYLLGKKDIEIVKKDRDLHDQKNQRNILLVVAFSTLLILAILVIFYRRIERKKVLLEEKNDQIIEQRNQLENLNQVKNRLFSVISHDLRNPLVTLRSYLSLSENENLSPEKKQLFKSQTIHAVTQTGEMLDNLLTWANMQIRNSNASITPIHLKDCILDVVDSLKPHAILKMVTLDVEVEDYIVPGDYEILSIALRNLITNAIKFSHENQEVKIQSIRENNQVKISIRDKGIGMTSEQIAQISQSINFSTAGTKGEKGSGLGLFLVKELLAKINATLDIESEIEQGSCFTIVIAAM